MERRGFLKALLAAPALPVAIKAADAVPTPEKPREWLTEALDSKKIPATEVYISDYGDIRVRVGKLSYPESDPAEYVNDTHWMRAF